MLKSIFLGIAVLLLAGVATAADSPIDKGSLFLDGSLFFKSQSGDLFETDGDGTSSWGAGNGSMALDGAMVEISPTLGYFIAPHIYIGGQFALAGFSRGKMDASLFAIGPSIGYYFNVNPARTEVRGSIYPYVRGFFNWGTVSSSDDIPILQYGGKGGLLYMLTDAVAADAAIQFRGDRWDLDGDGGTGVDDPALTGTTLWIGLGLTAFIY